MDPINSKDYHDYFIKDGKFIGRFEQMYQQVTDPWHIDALGRRLDMDAALLLLKNSGRDFHRILDVGCGKGFFTSLLTEVISGRIIATDISPTAISQARERYAHPQIEFFVFDLNDIEHLPYAPATFDLIVMAQTIWCILPNLAKLLGYFKQLLVRPGCLLISQHFLKPEQQKYGRDILSSAEGLLDLLQTAGFLVQATLETNRATNHHLAVLARTDA